MRKRRTRLTEDAVETIVEGLRQGLPVETAVGLSGVSLERIRAALREDEGFAQCLRQARAAGQKTWIAHLVRAAEEGKVTAVTDALKLFYPELRESSLGDPLGGSEHFQVVFEGVEPGSI